MIEFDELLAQQPQDVRDAIERRYQELRAIPEGSMRVAPGSDAVAWRVNADHCGEL